MGRSLPQDHLLSRKKPITKTVSVVLDPDLAEEYESVRRDRDVAQMRCDANPDDSDGAFALIEADQKLAELRQRLEADDVIVWFTFRGIGRTGYERLVDAHPITAEQRLKAKANNWTTVGWNFETFPPALVHACLVAPELSLEDIEAMWDSPDWNQAELQVLFDAAITVNGTRRTVELGKG